MTEASAPATTVRPTTIDPSTDASIRNGYRFTSPATKIGKTFWRFVVLPSLYRPGVLVTDYEWLNTEFNASGVWYPSNQWRTYNFNDGTYAGLPKSIRRLWERYHHKYDQLNATVQTKAAGGHHDAA